LVRLYFKFDS